MMTSHMYYKALCPLLTPNCTTRRSYSHQPEAKRRLDDKLNVSNVSRFVVSVHPRMREFNYAQ